MRRITPILVICSLLAVGSVFTVSAASRPTLSRAEAVALMVDAQPTLRTRLQWYIKHMPPMPLFLDANPKSWYGPYLETAFQAGIITSNGERMFRPKSNITVEEAAALMLKTKAKMSRGETIVFAPRGNRTWQEAVISDAIAAGISVPRNARVGSTVSMDQFHAMMRSIGVASPERIALTINPKIGYLQPTPARVAIRPLPGAAVAAPRPAQPTVTTTSNQRIDKKEFSISMPSLGVKDLKITHPSDPFTSKGLLAPLQHGVGHLFTYPGNDGKILIYGHSSSYPWDVSNYTKIFRQINLLKVGDKVTIKYDGEVHTYEVTSKEAVPASDMSRYQSSGEEELILYTCWPPDSISQRYLVHAKPV